MELKEINTLLEQELNEDKKLITNVVKGFPKDVSHNFKDAHKTLYPFGSLWGRGVLFKDEKGYFALVDSYGSSHSNIKRKREGKKVEKTFYFGYNPRNKALYIEDGSIGGDFNKPGLQAAIHAITNMGPLKGSIVKFR